MASPSKTALARPSTGPDVDVTRALRDLVANVERVVTGKREVVELAVVAVAAGGHLLVEDVPGVGKTVLARALARSVDGTFARVQGAPDLLPGDITGTTVYTAGTGRTGSHPAAGATAATNGDATPAVSPHQTGDDFRFVPGPIFATVVLVDELNRTTPRTQAALLEAMEEDQVTVDGVSHPLPVPHFVVATQNPEEHHGTYPLPESQLDRFSVATTVGYPTPDDEATVVRRQVRRHPLADLKSVLTTSQLADVRGAVRHVTVSDEVIDYVVRLVGATRRHQAVELGASPRASVQLIHATQALAALRDRGHVLPDDVKHLAVPVLAHRLLPRTAGADRGDPDAIVGELLRDVPVQ